ncbi:MAG: hypothetical protein ABEJ43_01775 [Haloferacaceae archaeon]
MTALVRAALVGVGLCAVAGAGAWVAVAGGASPGTLGRAAAALVGVVAVAAALARVWGRGDDPTRRPVVERAPERAPDDRQLAGRAFAEQLREARETARTSGVETGVEAVRPTLRATVVAVRVRAGDDAAAVERDLDDGEWTDDPVAAAALSPDIQGPERPLRRRLADWLRPDRAAARQVRRATDAVARVADERLPPVAGADAPRPAPVARPSLGELRQSVDGSLDPAADGESGEPRRWSS